MNSFKSLFLVTTLFLVSLSGLTDDADLTNDLTLWPMVSAQVPLYKDKFSLYGYWQPTVTSNISDATPWVFRGAVIYSPNDNLDLWLGYDRHYNLESKATFLENRIWQQATYDQKIKTLSLNHRVRLENRFIENINDPSFRLRYRARLTHPISKNKKWYAAASDEVFFNLNTVAANRQAGFVENRAYVGVGRKLNDFMTLEGGYQMAFVQGFVNSDLLRHSIVVNFAINVPYKKSKEPVPKKVLCMALNNVSYVLI